MALDGKPDLIAVLEYYAKIEGRDLDLTRVRETGWSKVRCIFHDDRNPSAQINLDTGHFRCFACSAPSGDSYDIIMEREGIGFNDARKWASDNLGYEGGEVRGPPAPREYRPSWLSDDDD